MSTPINSLSDSSIFSSMTISDWITAGIAIGSLLVAIIALCIPLYKSRTRLEGLDAYSLLCSEDLAILDFILVNRSSSQISITGIDLIGDENLPARRYSEIIPDIGSQENEKIVREYTTAFPITIAPFESRRIIAGFDQIKYSLICKMLMNTKDNKEKHKKQKQNSVKEVKTICVHTSRKDKIITLPYRIGYME